VTLSQEIFIWAASPIALALIYVYLRIIHAAPEKALPTKKPAADENTPLKASSLIEEGEVAGDYEEAWYKTFDLTFLIFTIAYTVVVLGLTMVYQPEMLVSTNFWLSNVAKVVVMMTVSLFGGILARHYCQVDSKGYIITNKASKFKVNYTRKLQHFAAYMVPLVIKSSFKGPLSLAWGDLMTMISFLVFIKPLREKFTFLMMQFNSLDRPEDRPNTLKWIIAGNIVPGLFILMFFKWLFADNGNLTFIIVFITGIGDGMAEPVGIAWGRHKYKTRGCFSKRKYTRSWEGSACVFLSGMIFPALQWRDFANFNQVLVAMLILPPTMAYAEAVAPHTMDTPVLMIASGIILYVILQVL